mgnify:CR=1 FL=1
MQLFIDAAQKPYNFYLCPPLNYSEKLVHIIVKNGGNVVTDLSQNCIIIASKEQPIPKELNNAHVYSYEVIQDSANRGAQQEFSNYLIHIPNNNNDSVPQQYAHKTRNEQMDLNLNDSNNNGINDNINNDNSNVNNSVVDDDEEEEDDDDDEIEEDEEEDTLQKNNENRITINNSKIQQETNYNDALGDIDFENLSRSLVNTGHSYETMTMTRYEDTSVRYFTAEEDMVLKEELRKRHWMGIKGHSVYDIISQLPYFRNRHRTATSIRERMRTLKFNLGYVYQLDANHRIMKDANGKYLRTTMITNKLTAYTASDDLILCKTVYFKLDIVTDEKGFETVIFPTNFYDKFAVVYNSHSAESWRQRFKNYISIFGITNYIKYYIMERQQGKTPLPVNLANKEWLQARKHIKKTDCPRLFFPHVPQSNDFIDEFIEFASIPDYDGRIFEFENPFRKMIAYNDNQSVNNDIGSRSKVSPKSPENYGNIDDELVKEDQRREKENVVENSVNDENKNSNLNILQESQKTNVSDSQKSSMPLFTPEIEFVDEPTTEFMETPFKKLQRKHGKPIKFEVVNDKSELIKKIRQIFHEHPNKISPKELSKLLLKVGVQEYYTVFLIYRCTSIKSSVEECIVNCINTNGVQLLAMKAGIWSNKSIQMFLKHDPELDKVLKSYHGEKAYAKQAKWIKTSKIV